MDSHNIYKAANDDSVRIETDEKDARVLRADLAHEDELSIDEDFDLGGDPYNSTGRHVIIKSRIELED